MVGNPGGKVGVGVGGGVVMVRVIVVPFFWVVSAAGFCFMMVPAGSSAFGVVVVLV